MTDRYHTLTVVLDSDYRDDDAQRILDAIKMVKGVADVQGNVSSITEYMAITRARQELGVKLIKVITGEQAKP